MAIDYTKRPAQPPQEPTPTRSSGPAPASERPVSLSKVTLTKAEPTVSLAKQAAGSLRVNLNWRPGGGGFLRKREPVDLDLGCLYEYVDGSRGVVQPIQARFTDQHTFGTGPIVRLDGDDRSGTVSGGENLHVDLTQVTRIRRILVFAFIYSGVPNWAAADGVVTVTPPVGPEVVVRLDEPARDARMCGIALLQQSGGELTVSREVRYTPGHEALDRAYGWGLSWVAASK